MDKMSYANRITSHQKIYLNPHELNINMEDTILNRLKEIEGRCINMGYIMKNSIVMIERKVGKIQNADNSVSGAGGKVIFNISYHFALISPKPEQIIPCRVQEVNKIGVLAFGGIEENNPLIITIMKQNHDDLSVFKDIRVKDTITIKVLSSSFKLKDKIIKVTGLYNKHISESEYENHKSEMRQRLFLES